MSNIAAFFSEVPVGHLVLFGVWILAMISLPIWRWIFGDRALAPAVSAGVYAQTLLVLVLTGEEMGRLPALAAAILVGFGGWLLEFVGSRTGVLFGRYEYTDLMQPQIAHVPVVIPLAWIMMMAPSWAVAQLLVPDAGALGFALVAGAAFVAWDLFLDPQMVGWGLWTWHDGGAYFGIPWRNFAGWFLGAAALSFVAHVTIGPLSIPILPLFAVYVVTWMLETIGQTFFWDLRGSAAFGFLGMGVFVVLAAFTGAAESLL